MAGRFTSFDALWAQRGLLRLGRINVERDGLEDFNFSRITMGAGDIFEAKWCIEGVRIGNTTIQILARRGQGLERVFRFFKAASV